MLKRGIELGGSRGAADEAGEQAAALGYRRALDHEARCGSRCPEAGELARAAGLIAPAAGRRGAPWQHVLGYALVLQRLSEHTRNLADMELAIRWLRRAADHPAALARARRQALNALAWLHVLRGAVLEGADAATALAEQRAAGQPDAEYTALLAELAGGDSGCGPGG